MARSVSSSPDPLSDQCSSSPLKQLRKNKPVSSPTFKPKLKSSLNTFKPTEYVRCFSVDSKADTYQISLYVSVESKLRDEEHSHQVDILKNENAALKNDNAALKTEMAALKTEMAAMQKTIAELMEQLNMVREEMSEMQKRDHSQLKKQSEPDNQGQSEGQGNASCGGESEKQGQSEDDFIKDIDDLIGFLDPVT